MALRFNIPLFHLTLMSLWQHWLAALALKTGLFGTQIAENDVSLTLHAIIMYMMH